MKKLILLVSVFTVSTIVASTVFGQNYSNQRRYTQYRPSYSQPVARPGSYRLRPPQFSTNRNAYPSSLNRFANQPRPAYRPPGSPQQYFAPPRPQRFPSQGFNNGYPGNQFRPTGNNRPFLQNVAKAAVVGGVVYAGTVQAIAKGFEQNLKSWSK